MTPLLWAMECGKGAAADAAQGGQSIVRHSCVNSPAVLQTGQSIAWYMRGNLDGNFTSSLLDMITVNIGRRFPFFLLFFPTHNFIDIKFLRSTCSSPKNRRLGYFTY